MIAAFNAPCQAADIFDSNNVTCSRTICHCAPASYKAADVISVRTRDAAFDGLEELLKKEGLESVAAGPSARSMGLEDRMEIRAQETPETLAAAQVGVVRADYAAAETGTLVHLDSGDEEKMAWTLPPLCVCLLEADRIVPDLDSLVDVFSSHLKRSGLPGPQVSLVTGPSRTADIECELTIGVQGPKRLVVWLIDSSPF